MALVVTCLGCFMATGNAASSTNKPRSVSEIHEDAHQVMSGLNILMPGDLAERDKKPHGFYPGLEINFDQAWQERNNNYTGNGYNRMVLSNAIVDLQLRMFDWVNMDVSAAHSETPNGGDAGGNSYSDSLETAYMSVGNFYKMPVTFTYGYNYLPFGVYHPYALSSTVTQNMNQSQATMFQVNYETRNIYTSVYAFGRSGKVNGTSRRVAAPVNNFGADLGYTWHSFHQGAHVNVSYISNYREVNLIKNLNPTSLKRVSAMALHASYYHGYYGGMIDYTTTLSRFNSDALSFNGKGAKPHAIFGEVYRHFKTLGKESVAGLGFGNTWQGIGVSLPKHRWLLNYQVELNRLISLQAQYTLAKDYGTGDSGIMERDNANTTTTGTGKDNNTFEVRLSFALGDQVDSLDGVYVADQAQ